MRHRAGERLAQLIGRRAAEALRTEDALSRDAIREIAEVYNANVVESVKNAMIVELTEVPSRIDAFLDVISNFDVIETCRSGVTAMAK